MNLAALLWRRKVLILSVTAVSITIALAVTMGMPEVYRASATVLVTPPGYRPEIAPKPPSAETYKEIATTPAVVQGALERANLTGEDRPAGWSLELAMRRMRVETYEERGPYNSVLVSPLLGLSVTDTDPERAAAVANSWAQSFQEVSQRFKGQGSHRLAEALGGQAETASRRLTETEENLRAFRQRAGLAVLAEETRVQAQSLAAARGSRLAIEGEIESTAGMVATLSREIASAAGSAGGEDTSALGGRMADAARALAETSRELREYRREMNVTKLEEELAAEKSRLAGHRGESVRLETRLARASAEVERSAVLLGEESGGGPSAALRASLADAPRDGDATSDRLSELALLEQLQDSALQSLRDRYFQARVDTETLGPLIESYRKKIADAQRSILDLEQQVGRHNDHLALLSERRSQAMRRVQDLGKLQSTLHQDVASLAVELERLEARAGAARNREKILRSDAARLDARLTAGRLQEEHLVAELQRVRNLHDSLAAKAQEAKAAEVGNASDVSIVSRAAVPERPVSPRLFLNLLAAAVFGLAASAALLALTGGSPGAVRG